MVTIVIEPEELFGYIRQHETQLKDEMHEVARNDDYDISIYITGRDEVKNRYSIGQIVVCNGDEEIYREPVVGEEDVQRTARRIYNKYLSPTIVEALNLYKQPAKNDDADDDEEDDPRLEREALIEDREIELDDALQAFLDAVCEHESSSYYIDDDILGDIKEHFLEYIARKWKLPVYRPMMLEDEDGKEFFEDYPYESMIFDDEDNPIYNPPKEEKK